MTVAAIMVDRAMALINFAARARALFSVVLVSIFPVTPLPLRFRTLLYIFAANDIVLSNLTTRL
jgi:hypothetical protein